MLYLASLEGLAHFEHQQALQASRGGSRRGARRIAMEARRVAENELRDIDAPLGRRNR